MVCSCLAYQTPPPSTQWSFWQQFQWPLQPPEQNRWSKFGLCFCMVTNPHSIVPHIFFYHRLFLPPFRPPNWNWAKTFLPLINCLGFFVVVLFFYVSFAESPQLRVAIQFDFYPCSISSYLLYYFVLFLFFFSLWFLFLVFFWNSLVWLSRRFYELEFHLNVRNFIKIITGF